MKERYEEEDVDEGRRKRTHRLSKAKRRDCFPAKIAAENIARASTHGGGGSGGGGAEHICFATVVTSVGSVFRVFALQQQN